MKELKQSETVVIKRSQINFAPYNPKRHTKEAISQQKKNFKEIGFLGGIVWNATTGNLVSGHKRVMALDEYYGYDGTSDYDIKVEKAELTEKQEKEQNVFMDARSTNTQQDYDLLAQLLPDIDYKAAGLTDEDLNMITVEVPDFNFGEIDEIKQDIQEMSARTTERNEIEKEARKAHVKEVKAQQKAQAEERFEGEPYVTLSFSSYENKLFFMERFGFNPDDKFIKGELFNDMVERTE